MTGGRPCCAPGRAAAAPAGAAPHRSGDGGANGRPVLVALAGGVFAMGHDGPEVIASDGEAPVRPVRVSPFAIAPLAVTNDDFAAFVRATGHVTEAERFGWSFVFHAALAPEMAARCAAPRATPWFRQVEGACWHAPAGPGSEHAGIGDHPVVHVSHGDALAYCRWSGTRLPTEAEREFAARGGLERRRYPWGDDLTPGGRHLCNLWQGRFPQQDTAEDGFAGTAPVASYPPNGYGLYQMTGNVWEWCADDLGPDPADPGAPRLRALRGGSHLCHASWCGRYRVSSRLVVPGDSGTGHIGFRVAADSAA